MYDNLDNPNRQLLEVELAKLIAAYKEDINSSIDSEERRLLTMVKACLTCARYAVARYNKRNIQPSIELVNMCMEYLTLADIELEYLEEEEKKFKTFLLNNEI